MRTTSSDFTRTRQDSDTLKAAGQLHQAPLFHSLTISSSVLAVFKLVEQNIITHIFNHCEVIKFLLIQSFYIIFLNYTINMKTDRHNDCSVSDADLMRPLIEYASEAQSGAVFQDEQLGAWCTMFPTPTGISGNARVHILQGSDIYKRHLRNLTSQVGHCIFHNHFIFC